MKKIILYLFILLTNLNFNSNISYKTQILEIDKTKFKITEHRKINNYQLMINELLNCIKKYETLHINNSQYIGYGHFDTISKNRNLDSIQSDSLLRKDFNNFIHYYNLKNDKDSVLKALLYYNGVKKVHTIKKMNDSLFLSCNTINNIFHSLLQQRRIDELNIYNKYNL